MTESAAHVRVIEETSAYWRVRFENPPFNIVDATIFEGLQDLLARMDASPSLRVVVFESANPEFRLAGQIKVGKVELRIRALEYYDTQARAGVHSSEQILEAFEYGGVYNVERRIVE